MSAGAHARIGSARPPSARAPHLFLMRAPIDFPYSLPPPPTVLKADTLPAMFEGKVTPENR